MEKFDGLHRNIIYLDKTQAKFKHSSFGFIF